MKIVLSVLTVAGGHLLAGKRMRGYLYLFALVSLPILSLVVEGIWLMRVPEGRAEAPDVAARFFWIALAIVWLSSIGLLMRDRWAASSAREPSRRGLLFLETIAVSIASIIVIGFSALSIGVLPFLPKETRSEVHDVGKARVRGQELPNREGSVQFLGTLYIKGTVASNRRLVFVFDKGFRSRGIVTDHEGKFIFRLPPGRWTLLAPDLPGFPGSIRAEIKPPLRDLSFDVSEGPVSQTYTLTVHAD